MLADALAREGVVTLRYDKRGTGATGMPSGGVTWPDYVEELAKAAEFLSTQSFVDKQRIVIAGHSEGGAHALKVAANPPVAIAGVVLLSSAGRSLSDIVLWQISQQILGSGLPKAASDAEIAALKGALTQIAAGKDVDPTKVGQLPGVQQFIAALQNPQSVDFAREILVFEPKNAFAAFDLPVLVLSGARDIQVDPELDAKPLAKASQAAGRQTELVIIPTADHVLKHEPTPRENLDASAGFRYNAPDRQLADGVVESIATWTKGVGEESL